MKILMHAACPYSPNMGVSRVMIELSKELRNFGFEVDFLFGSGGSSKNMGSYLADLKGPLKILKHTSLTSLFFKNAISHKKYDIIHSNTAEASFDVIKSKNSAKILTHLHGTDSAILSEWKNEIKLGKAEYDFMTDFYLNKSISKNDFVFKNSKNFSAISETVIKETELLYGVTPSLVRNGFSSLEKKVIVQNPEKIREKLGISKSDLMVLFVGNNAWRKGLFYLLDSLELLPDNYKLVVIGLGKKESKILKSSKIINLGQICYAEVFQYYAIADVFCLPSVYEPFGLVYLEALSMGTPVIGCFGTGAEEIISNGVNGFLVPKRNALSIVEAVKKVVKLKKKSSIIEGDFSWKKSAKSLIGIYDSLE